MVKTVHNGKVRNLISFKRINILCNR